MCNTHPRERQPQYVAVTSIYLSRPGIEPLPCSSPRAQNRKFSPSRVWTADDADFELPRESHVCSPNPRVRRWNAISWKFAQLLEVAACLDRIERADDANSLSAMTPSLS